MKSCTVVIGNSDNKLTQHEWANFITQVTNVVASRSQEVHSIAHTRPDSIYQTAVFVFAVEKANLEPLRKDLATAARHYRQESITLMVAKPEFVAGDTRPTVKPGDRGKELVVAANGVATGIVLGDDFTLGGIKYRAEIGPK